MRQERNRLTQNNEYFKAPEHTTIMMFSFKDSWW